MKKKILLALVAVALLVGGGVAYTHAKDGSCCGKSADECCGKCGGDMSKCPVK